MNGEMRTRIAIPTLTLLAVTLAGCGSDASDSTSADEFYAAMKIGKFATMTPEQLDKIAKGLCGDLGNMKPEERKLATLVIRDSVDTDEEAFKAGQAMTARWCPQHAKAFDY